MVLAGTFCLAGRDLVGLFFGLSFSLGCGFSFFNSVRRSRRLLSRWGEKKKKKQKKKSCSDDDAGGGDDGGGSLVIRGSMPLVCPGPVCCWCLTLFCHGQGGVFDERRA